MRGQPGRAQPRKGQPRRQREGEGGPGQGRKDSTRGPPPLSSSALVSHGLAPPPPRRLCLHPSPLLPLGSLASSIWFFPCSHQMSPPQGSPPDSPSLTEPAVPTEPSVGQILSGLFFFAGGPLLWACMTHVICMRLSPSTPVPHHQGSVPTGDVTQGGGQCPQLQ